MESLSAEKTDKDIVLSEILKTLTRLRNQNVNVNGTYFGINDKLNIDDESDIIPEEGFSNGDHVFWKPEDEFIKLYPKALRKVFLKLTGSEAFALIGMMPFIDYESGMFKINKIPMITKDITELTGFSKVTTIKIIDKLIEERIISRNHVGRTFEYFANPHIFFKGKYINKTLLDMFKEYK